jgi:2,3-bisphosphoglycerate-independent phosphoglycerate mutase
MIMINRPRPLALIILDGWGYREEIEDNAIAQAKKPFWNYLWQHYPHTLISGCGRCVGLPDGQMGNSEVGHLNMGAGRVVHQDLTRIDTAITDKTFFSNPILVKAIDQAVQSQKAVHILGLLSSGGVHSHERQISALIELAAQRHATHVYFHAFLDGRDTPPKSAEPSLNAFTEQFNQLQCGKIASVIGRYYAMDRDKRWDRIQKAYDLLTAGIAEYQTTTAMEALQLAYDRDETDEFVSATRINNNDNSPITINDGDTVIFMNFRADRAREITSAFVDPHFKGFQRHKWPKVNFVSLTEYDKTFPIDIAFSPESLKNILGEYLSNHHLKQLRIAETEKYAHVTFFFNGGIEQPYPGEDRILIPSPAVTTYDLQPEMSAPEVTEELVKAIRNEQYDAIICNFANPDMLGHTGNLPATIKAIETIDTCLEKIITALQYVGGEAIITADHGNAEIMFDHCTHQAHTAHTTELVPFIYVGRPATIAKKQGILSDIAPTMLYLMNLPQPKDMTGEPILHL